MAATPGSLGEDLRFRGLVHQVTDERLLAMIDAEDMTAYIGFDPTAASLGVGNLLQLCTLRRFQLAGHRPIALAGGGTGAIGDPGGKSEERPLLSKEDLARQLAGIRAQLEHFFDVDRPLGAVGEGTGAGAVAGGAGDAVPKALLLDNAEWLGAESLIDFLRDVGKHFTVNQMVAKESVKSRMQRPEHGISFTEFSYMLLQAYDFLQLYDRWGCRLQLGGSDQWGNITMGTDLIRKVRQSEAFGLTTPLVTKADGTKFGKTESGSVWLDASLTSPFRLYQFFVQTGDDDVGAFLRYFTFLTHDEIRTLDAQVRDQPARQEAQRVLAREVTTLVHGIEEADRAARASVALFSGKLAELDEETFGEVVADAPSSTLDRRVMTASDGSAGPGSVSLIDALVDTALVSSRGEARRTLSQGGAYVNDVRQDDVERVLTAADLLHDHYIVLRRGRRQYHVIEVR